MQRFRITTFLESFVVPFLFVKHLCACRILNNRFVEMEPFYRNFVIGQRWKLKVPKTRVGFRVDSKLHPDVGPQSFSTVQGSGMDYCGGQFTTAVVANSLNFLSIGTRSSQRVGACRMIPAVPTSTANVKIQRNSLSKTIATYFQSSFTFFFANCAYQILQVNPVMIRRERIFYRN